MCVMNLGMVSDIDTDNDRKLQCVDVLLGKNAGLKSADAKCSSLYWSVYKHQFELANKLIEHGADCSMLNHNASNLMHILFSNFDGDLVNAPALADALLPHVDPNLVDREGKSPLHVAIKKQ